MAVVTQIQVRRGTAAQWTSANPILASGEWGYETDTNKAKIGNGSTAWTSLSYIITGAAGTVTSITAGTGLTGGTITATGTIAIDSTVTTLTGTQTLTNKTLTSPTMSAPLLQSPEERWTVSATAANTSVTFDVTAQGVLYYTANATANWTLAATNVNASLAVGDAISIVFAVTNGATAYRPTALTIDGAANTPKWAGGTAPAAGNINAVDWYSYVIVKTAATPTYTVFAGQSAKFA